MAARKGHTRGEREIRHSNERRRSQDERSLERDAEGEAAAAAVSQEKGGVSVSRNKRRRQMTRESHSCKREGSPASVPPLLLSLLGPDVRHDGRRRLRRVTGSRGEEEEEEAQVRDAEVVLCTREKKARLACVGARVQQPLPACMQGSRQRRLFSCYSRHACL